MGSTSTPKTSPRIGRRRSVRLNPLPKARPRAGPLPTLRELAQKGKHPQKQARPRASPLPLLCEQQTPRATSGRKQTKKRPARGTARHTGLHPSTEVEAKQQPLDESEDLPTIPNDGNGRREIDIGAAKVVDIDYIGDMGNGIDEDDLPTLLYPDDFENDVGDMGNGIDEDDLPTLLYPDDFVDRGNDTGGMGNCIDEDEDDVGDDLLALSYLHDFVDQGNGAAVDGHTSINSAGRDLYDEEDDSEKESIFECQDGGNYAGTDVYDADDEDEDEDEGEGEDEGGDEGEGEDEGGDRLGDEESSIDAQGTAASILGQVESECGTIDAEEMAVLGLMQGRWLNDLENFKAWVRSRDIGPARQEEFEVEAEDSEEMEVENSLCADIDYSDS